MRLCAFLLFGLASAAMAQGSATQGSATQGSATQGPAPQTAPAVDPLDKMICRRQAETGSLVRARRECHTRRQWAYLDEQHQAAGRTLVDDTRSRPNGN